jgi:hypothetical protein
MPDADRASAFAAAVSNAGGEFSRIDCPCTDPRSSEQGDRPGLSNAYLSRSAGALAPHSFRFRMNKRLTKLVHRAARNWGNRWMLRGVKKLKRLQAPM